MLILLGQAMIDKTLIHVAEKIQPHCKGKTHLGSVKSTDFRVLRCQSQKMKQLPNTPYVDKQK